MPSPSGRFALLLSTLVLAAWPACERDGTQPRNPAFGIVITAPDPFLPLPRLTRDQKLDMNMDFGCTHHGQPDEPLADDVSRAVGANSPLQSVRILSCSEEDGLSERFWWNGLAGQLTKRPCLSPVRWGERGALWLEDSTHIHWLEPQTAKSGAAKLQPHPRCETGAPPDRCYLAGTPVEADGAVWIEATCRCEPPPEGGDRWDWSSSWIRLSRRGHAWTGRFGTEEKLHPPRQDARGTGGADQHEADVTWPFDTAESDGATLDVVARLPDRAAEVVATVADGEPDDWFNAIHGFGIAETSASGRWQLVRAEFILDPSTVDLFWLFDRQTGRFFAIQSGGWPKPLPWDWLAHMEYLEGDYCRGALEVNENDPDEMPHFVPGVDLLVAGDLHVVPGLGGWQRPGSEP